MLSTFRYACTAVKAAEASGRASAPLIRNSNPEERRPTNPQSNSTTADPLKALLKQAKGPQRKKGLHRDRSAALAKHASLTTWASHADSLARDANFEFLGVEVKQHGRWGAQWRVAYAVVASL